MEGLKGLQAQDRAGWEKQYADQIKGFTPEQTDRTYRNFKFKEKFGQREDYDSLKKLSPEQRDSLYNEDTEGSNVSPFSLPDNRDENQQLTDSITKSLEAAAPVKEKTDKLYDRYSNYPGEARKELDNFNKIAETVSPYYKRYKDTEYLPLNDDEKLRIMADYNAAKQAYGEEEANMRLRTTMQDTASKNQSTWEKYWNGFKGMGAQTAGALIGAAGMIKGAIDYVGDEANPELNPIQDFFDHVIDNNWTRYGNDVMQYGSLFDANIQDAKQNGGISNIPIIRTAGEENGSILDNLLSVNTIPELINQQGFTIASMLSGAGLSSISNKAFQGLKGAAIAANRAGALNNLEKVNTILKGLQQAQQKANAFVIPALVGTVEGVSEGLNTKIQFLDDAKEQISRAQNKIIEEEFNRRLQDPEKLAKEGYNPQDAKDLQRLHDDIFNSYSAQYEESINKAEANAAKAGVYNMGLNSLINGALNMTLKAGLQTPSVQEALRRSRMGRLFNPKDFKVSEAGKVTPTFGRVNKVLNVLQEPAGEFTEEYLQSVTDAFARGGAEYDLNNFILNKYKGDGKNAVDDSLADNFFAASRAAGDAMVDKETILAGIYGALASGMGTPTINNRRGPAVRTADESKLDYALRRSPITYRNPIFEAIQEQKEMGEDRSTSADVMTSWIQDPQNKSKYDGLVGTFNWAQQMEKAADKNDEFEYRNSELGKTINDVMTLQKLQGTEYYDSFMNDLTRVANVEEGSDEAAALVQQFKNALSNRDIQQDDAAILSTIKKNSNKLLNTMSTIAKESESLDKMLGNAADEDTKQALIFGKISADNWRERATQLENELGEVQLNSTITGDYNDAQRDAVINYGSVDKAREEKDKIRGQIHSLREDIDNILSRKNILGDKEMATVNLKRASIKTLEKQAKKLSGITDETQNPILSETEIMSLNPTDRAAMLNPDNKSRYSEEQQEIINNVIREGTAKYNDFVDKVQDAGRINLAQQAYLTQYNNILSDPRNFNAFANRIKQQVADDNTKKKYEYLSTIQDYATFVKGLDKAYSNADPRERSVIASQLKDNPNYNRYIEDNKNLEGIFDQLDTNEKFSDLEENDKNLLMTSMQYLVDKGISPTSAVAAEELARADEQGNSELLSYINDLNGRLPEGQKLTPSSVEGIIQTFNDVLGEHSKNIKEVETVNKPIQPEPTPVEASKPPMDIFAQVKRNPAMAADIDLKEEDKPKEAPKQAATDIFAQVKQNPELARGVQEEVDIVDKYKTNSNDQVAEVVGEGLNTINKALPVFDDVKARANEVINELGDSEYSEPDDLKQAIIAKANELQTLSENSGDANERLSSLLKQTASKMKVKEVKPKVEKASTPSIAEEETRNSSLIYTADVERHPNSSVGQASKNYRMNDYLRKGHITPKTQIMFTADPAIIGSVKQEMGEVYNESDHLPIMAIVEDSEGPLTIDNKRYQPIGFMPRTSANTQGAARMNPIRMLALQQQDGSLIKRQNGEVITTNGYVRAVPPEHTKAGTPNTPIQSIMRNDMDASDIAKMDDQNLPLQERQAIYRKNKEKIIKNIKRVAQDAKGERIHLAYVTPNMKGGETEFELYVTTPQNSVSRTGRPIADLLVNGTPEEVIKGNSRLHRYGKTLEEFFKKKPFSSDIKFKREQGGLIPTGEGATKLASLSENLTKKLANFITIPKGYEYTLTPTEKLIEGNRFYNLGVTNGADYILLAKVTNGTMTDATKAQAIKNLMLDGGNFRQNGSQPFAIWQVNYNDFNERPNESEDARRMRLNNANDIFDDNILDSSRTSFKYNIKGIQINSPFSMEDSKQPAPTPVVANQVNATQGKPLNTPVITATDQVKVGKAIVDSESGAVLEGKVDPVSIPVVERAKEVANRVVEDSKDIRLADDNSGYVDSEGRRYARVTSIIQADEHAGERFDANNPWVIPSTNIGTSVDEFVRDFFAGNLNRENGLPKYPNATSAQWVQFEEQLKGLKSYLDSKGLTVIPRDVTVTGTVKVTDQNGQTHDILVAGTLDLLAYDQQGNFHIFDMKTNRSGIDEHKKEKYAKQVSMYQKFLEDKYGVRVASLNIIPINVTYPAPKGFGKGNAEYSVKEGTQLLERGKEYRDARPTLEQVGGVPFTDVNIQYNRLTDSEKQMITDMLPSEVEVKKVEIPDTETKVDPISGLKRGKVKNRFATPKKAKLVTPSANLWESLNETTRQKAESMGYTKDSWNSMTEDEKQHQKECIE